jgi:GAF domain
MDPEPPQPVIPFVPVLAWPGRRPSLGEMATWYEALRGAVGVAMPLDLMAFWLYPSRGGSLLVGPRDLPEERLAVPAAEPLVPQEALFTLEDQLTAAGYRSVMAVPIRAEVQDVGLLVAASFAPDAYQLHTLRTLHRVAGQLATTCRRLAAQPWVIPAPAGEERTVVVAGVTEGLLDAMDRGRDGRDLVQLASDALANQLPHDRLEMFVVAPAPECWALLGADRAITAPVRLDNDTIDAVDALVHHFGARALLRIADLAAEGVTWPAVFDQRGAGRLRSLLAARLEVGGEFVGWLCLGSDTADWFHDDDLPAARLAARILAPRVAAWQARAELAGVWG